MTCESDSYNLFSIIPTENCIVENMVTWSFVTYIINFFQKYLFHSFSLKGIKVSWYCPEPPSQLACYGNRIMLSALQCVGVRVKGQTWTQHFFWQAWHTYIPLAFLWNWLEFELGGSISWGVKNVKCIFLRLLWPSHRQLFSISNFLE